MPEINEKSLLRRARRGDTNAYGEIVDRYQRLVFYAAYRILGIREDAEDASQETFVRAYQNLRRFDLDRPFGPWIRRIATNLSLNMLRGRRPQDLLEEERDHPAPPALNPEVMAIQSAQREQVHDLLMQLPDHYRAVIVLRHYHDMSYAEMANVLDEPVSTVKSNLFRARRKLAEMMVTHGT